jgi:hypothetical protein
VRSARSFFARTIRTVKLLAREGRIPKTLRWAAAFGLLPIPGPADEAVLVLVGLLLWLFYRDTLADAWLGAEDGRFADRITNPS